MPFKLGHYRDSRSESQEMGRLGASVKLGSAQCFQWFWRACDGGAEKPRPNEARQIVFQQTARCSGNLTLVTQSVAFL